jgi:hypothetical protein
MTTEPVSAALVTAGADQAFDIGLELAGRCLLRGMAGIRPQLTSS